MAITTLIRYTEDAVLIADNEDNLQRLLHQFTISCQKCNTNISTNKTKTVELSKGPLRCKLEIQGKMIEQVMS
jgi:hypothetical protein